MKKTAMKKTAMKKTAMKNLNENPPTHLIGPPAISGRRGRLATREQTSAQVTAALATGK